MPRVGKICIRHSCRLFARYRVRASGEILCPHHAAEVCAIVVVEDYHPSMAVIAHGTRRGYRQEIRAGLDTCTPCRLAHKKSKIVGTAA